MRQVLHHGNKLVRLINDLSAGFEEIESVIDKSRVTLLVTLRHFVHIGFSFIFQTVNLFRHHTLIEHGLYHVL